MRKIKYGILLFLFPFCLLWGDELDAVLSKYTAKEIARFIGEAIIEPVEKSFSTIAGSEKFIEKFSLNKKEQDMIGHWGFDSIITTSVKQGEGPGPSVCFFPNRYFYIYTGSSNEQGRIKYIAGYWKVVQNRLMLRFIYRLKIVEPRAGSADSGFAIERGQDAAYYPIFTVPDYKKYYVNTEPFDWTAIPEPIRGFYAIKLNDSPRGRLLFDTLGVPPGDIRSGSKRGDILLNPQETHAYILDLINVW